LAAACRLSYVHRPGLGTKVRIVGRSILTYRTSVTGAGSHRTGDLPAGACRWR
jgi:hypothetical protein